jgi:hypothetical protein
MKNNFPDKHELKDQIERGYIPTDQQFDMRDFMAFIYFENWRKGNGSLKESRRELEELGITKESLRDEDPEERQERLGAGGAFFYSEHLRLIARGAWLYYEPRIAKWLGLR